MFNNLLALLGDFAKLKHSQRSSFGAYSITRDLKIRVSDNLSTYKRDYKAVEEFTALGKLGVIMDMPVDDPRGLNAAVIDETGVATPDLLVAKAKQAGGIARTALTSMQACPDVYMRFDSHIALLVSLLSTMYVLSYKEEKLPLSLREYNDGHVKLDLINSIAGTTSNNDWRADLRTDTGIWDQTTFDTEPTHPVISGGNLSTKDLDIIVMHLSGRRRTTQLSFDLDIPMLAEKVNIANTRYSNDTHLELTAIKASDVRVALDKYVYSHRLEGAFEAALAIYHQAALTPMPDTAEGYAWLIRPRSVVLPKFDSFRGAYNFLLREKPFGIDAAPKNTWKWWKESGLSTVVPAAMFTACSLWGRYLVEGKFYHGDADVSHLGHLEFSDNPASAFYSYAALITGQDVYIPIPASLGLQYHPWDQEDEYLLPASVIDVEASGYEVRTIAGRNNLVVKNCPPPCSAATVIGRMPREGAFSALSDKFSVEFHRVNDGWMLPNMDSAWAFAMAARWGGYNTEMEYRGQRRLGNWAPNQTAIATRPFHVEGPDIRTVTLLSVTPRNKTFFDLPSMGGDTNTWHVEVLVQPNMTVRANAATPKIGTIGVYSPSGPGNDTVVKIDRSLLTYVPAYVRATSRATVRQAGFTVVGTLAPGVPPDPISSSAQEDVPEDESGQVDQPGSAD